MAIALSVREPIVCFDLDGPILDVSERYYQVYLDLLRELSREQIAPLTKDEYWERKRARVSEESILSASGIVDDAASTYSELRGERLEALEYLRFDKPWPGMMAALRSAGEKFEVIAATLRSSRARLMAQLEMLGLIDAFHAIVSAPVAEQATERGEAKARLVGNLYGANGSGWFIGDTETDIIAGKALGWQTVGVSFGIRNEEILSAAQPDLLVRSPQELINWIERLQ